MDVFNARWLIKVQTVLFWLIFSLEEEGSGLPLVVASAAAAAEPITDDNIKSAIQLWQQNPSQAQRLYGGSIEEWDTSRVTSLGSAFQGIDNFHADLSDWDIGSVTSMDMIFYNCKNFGANLQNWDTSQVEDMAWAFHSTENFHAILSDWDISSVTTMDSIFKLSKNFQSDLSPWRPAQVRTMASAFYDSYNFQSDVSDWIPTSVTSMTSIFEGSSAFKSDITAWETPHVQYFTRAFYGASWFQYPICWDLSSAYPNEMTQFSCLTSGGFDCSCNSLKEEKHRGLGTYKKKKKKTDFCKYINSHCTGRNPAPPCIPVPNTQSACPTTDNI